MVTVQGEQETLNKLSKFVHYENELAKEFPRFGRDVAKRFAQLPYPAPAGGGYTRTFDLKGSFESRKTGHLQVTITNDANERGRYYSGFVVQKATQVAIHRGRWWTAEGSVLPMIADFEKEIAKQAQRTWEAR